MVGRNVIRESWGREINAAIPLDEAGENLIYDLEQEGTCVRCLKNSSDFQYDRCLHRPWCRQCKEWADSMVHCNFPHPHLCVVCELEYQTRREIEDETSGVAPKPGDLLKEIVLEMGSSGHSYISIDEHLARSKLAGFCHRCQAQTSHFNLPCRCDAWCDRCISWANTKIQRETAMNLCVRCKERVTATQHMYSRFPTYDLTPQPKADKQARKKYLRARNAR